MNASLIFSQIAIFQLNMPMHTIVTAVYVRSPQNVKSPAILSVCMAWWEFSR